MKRKRSRSVPGTSNANAGAAPTLFGGSKGKNVFQGSEQSLLIMVLSAGESRCFYGAASVQCIAGDVCVDGFSMRGGSFEREKMHPVCAPYRMGRPAIFHANHVSDPLGVHYKPNRLKYRLKELTPHYEEVMRVVGDRQPSVLVIDVNLPAPTEVVQQLAEDMLVPSMMRDTYHVNRTWFFPVGEWKLYEDGSVKALEEALVKIDRKRREGSRCAVVPCAGKGTGKSTLVRHLVNMSLNPDSPPIYVMDVDVGQSEFTPTGCMSLWKVTSPLLDLPWCHQTAEAFPCAYFFGAVQAADSTDKYLNIFDRLLNEFNSTSEPGSLLIVNTMGWIEGTGEKILHHIIQQTQPYLAVTMPSIRGLFTVPTCVPKTIMVRPRWLTGTYVPEQIRSRIPQPRSITASELREFSMIGYMAHVMPRTVVSSLNEGRPYRIQFKNITFAVPEDYTYLKDKCFFGTINAQIVALCFPECEEDGMKTRRLLNASFMPQIMTIDPSTPLLKCIGYALIRAVDLDRKLIHLLTPLPPQDLERATVMARGTDILVPLAVIASQPGSCIPYLSQPESVVRGDVVPDLFAGSKKNDQHKRGFYPQTK